MRTKRAVLYSASAVFLGHLLVAGSSFAQDPAATPPPAAPAADAPAAPAPAPALTPPPADQPAAPVAPAVEETPKKKRSASEEIVVTGSRIRRKDLSTPAPITLINKEQMQQSGRVSLGDFLQTLPEQGNGTNTSVNNAGDGSTRINLRGLGENRTLVLVNGRRWVPGGLGANDSVDLNSIPAAAIDHIEILKDGASAVYGSDAISGVVNIITKKHFDSSEVSAFGGTTTHADGTQYSVDGSTGISGDKGSALFSAGWYQNYPVFAGNRDYASPQRFFDGSTGGTAFGTGIGGYFPSGSSTIPAGRILGFKRGATIPTASALYNNLMTQFPTARSFIWDPTAPLGWRPYKSAGLPPFGDQYNYQDVNYLTTPQTRFSLFSTGEAKMGSNARAYYEASFVQRNSKQQLAPEPLVLDPGGSNILTSGQNIYNPFGTDVFVRRRLLEFGPRTFIQDSNTYRFVAGIDGTLPEDAGPLRGWFWDISANYGRSQGTQDFLGSLDTQRIANAVGPSFIDSTGTPHCGTPTNIIVGCVPLDLFHGPGSITRDQVTALSYDGVLRSLNALTSVQANASGELFKLMSSRPVGLALGYEYRFQAGEQIPDPLAAFGESSDNNQLPTSGHYYSNEGYAELNIPLISDLPGVNNLELTAAVRFYDYSSFGSGATYKFGGLYRPIQGISLRGTYSTAFRAPSIADLFTGQVDSFENVTDPCSGNFGKPPANCGAAANNGDVSTQLKAKTGGNPNLQPETATTITGGLVFEPGVAFGVPAIKRLSLTVDYYTINITNLIQTLGANTILAGCYPTSGQPNQAYCALITRDPTTQFVTRINDFSQNAGGLYTNGVDFGLSYSVPTGAGNFNLLGDVTYVATDDLTLGNGQIVHGVGNWDLNASGIGGTYPHWRGLGGLNWSLSGFSAGVIGHYIGGIKECGDGGGGGSYSGIGLCYQDSTYQRAVSPYFSADVFLSYRFLTGVGKTTAMVGMNNVFDASPPFIANAFEANTDPTGGYDIVGRFVYARLQHTF